jgi:hypothetical protein
VAGAARRGAAKAVQTRPGTGYGAFVRCGGRRPGAAMA